MNALFICLLTASCMLTVSCIVAALFLRRAGSVTPKMRQWVLLGVLLQGLMLFRLPIDLPWLEPQLELLSASTPAGDIGFAGGIPVDLAATNIQGGDTSIATSVEGASSIFAIDGASEVGGISSEFAWSELLVTAAVTLWIVGFLAFVFVGLRRYFLLCRLMRELHPAPQAWQREWSRVCRSRDRTAPEMLVSDSAGPMLVRRPRGYALVVPESFWSRLSWNERRGVLLHECAHLCRHDVWRQLVARFAASLHWWNPAAWWCIRRYEESAEWSCDEALTRNDPDAARGLAASLVRLIDFLENDVLDKDASPRQQISSGLGVQLMAAPPLTARVTRLLTPTSHGDSMMKRLFLGVLAAGLLAFSAVQFRLVAADPVETAAEEEGLQVLESNSRQQLMKLRERLDDSDKATSDLKQLLESESGQVAFAGLVDLIEDRYREKARGEMIPRFIEKHFVTEGDMLVLRESSKELAESWISRSEQLGEVLGSMHERMLSIAERLDESSEINRLAKRMLSDKQAGFAIMLDEFDGRSDPIELFIAKALERILVQRGEKMVVVPTLGAEQRRQIERFEVATRVAEKLEGELPEFAEEFATNDERHRELAKAMGEPVMAAILALHITEDVNQSASIAVEELFERLEHISRDTADGLVIDDEEAWEHISEMTEAAERSQKRLAAVRAQLRRIAEKLDPSDEMTQRFAKELESGIIAYQIAAEVPYAEFDLGQQIEGMVSQVMEPVGSNGLQVRPDAAEQVREHAEELLTACRTIRRYLRRVDTIREQMADRELAEMLDGPGRMILLTEVRNQAMRFQAPSADLIEKEFFVVDASTGKLTVHPQRVELVGQLIERAAELEEELKKDDF